MILPAVGFALKKMMREERIWLTGCSAAIVTYGSMPPVQKTPYKTMEHWTTDVPYAPKIRNTLYTALYQHNALGPGLLGCQKYHYTPNMGRVRRYNYSRDKNKM